MALSGGNCGKCGEAYPAGATNCAACGALLNAPPAGGAVVSRLPRQQPPLPTTIRDAPSATDAAVPHRGATFNPRVASLVVGVLAIGGWALAKWYVLPFVFVPRHSGYAARALPGQAWDLPLLINEPIYSLRPLLGPPSGFLHRMNDGTGYYLNYQKKGAALTLYYHGNKADYFEMTLQDAAPGDGRARLMESGNLKSDSALCTLEFLDAAGNVITADNATAEVRGVRVHKKRIVIPDGGPVAAP